MFSQDVNFKEILGHPLSKLAIALSIIALFLLGLFTVIDKEYNLNSSSTSFNFCFISCNQTGGKSDLNDGTIINPPLEISEQNKKTIIITPTAATVISGGVSTVGLGILIGVGVIEAPILVALAGGAAFSLITYGAIQALY